MSAVPQFLKRLESLLALAKARALSAAAAIANLSNHTAQVNGAPLGPGPGPFSFGIAGFTPASGVVRVWVEATVTGTTIVAGDVLTLQITRDGQPFGMPASVTALTGAAPATLYPLSAVFEDTVTPGTAHLWSARVSASAHTFALAIANIGIVITALPG
jgi:hypothetical protein